MNLDNKQKLITERIFSEMKDTFFFQVHKIQKAIFRKGNQIFQAANVTLQLEQFPILLTVDAVDGMSQKEIARVTRRDKSSIQRTLTALEKKELLRIERDDVDKRKNLVFITEEGRELAKKIKKLIRQAEEETFAILSDAERETAIATLKSIAIRLDIDNEQ